MHDVLSQYFPSIKNGANTFYINKVSKGSVNFIGDTDKC
jgi:hypothetical protein